MNIFDHDNYKEALKLYMRNQSQRQRGLFKDLAEHLGVHPTLVSQILSGPRDFSEEQIFAVCEYLRIPKAEANYLWILVQIERAGSVKLKAHYLALKEKAKQDALQVSHRVHKDRELTDSEKATFYSSWLYSAIQVTSTLEENVDFEFICKKFHLHPNLASDMLDFLIQIQLIEKKDGRFIPGATSTHLEKKSPFVVKHHANWRLKAIQASENLSDEELIYSANFSVSKKDFGILREEMVQVIQRFLAVVQKSPAEDIAQFNLDFFWVRP